MTRFYTKHRSLIVYALMAILTLVTLRTPKAQMMLAEGLEYYVELTEKIVQLPCWIVDHSRHFSLDRLDPTCPQCI